VTEPVVNEPPTTAAVLGIFVLPGLVEHPQLGRTFKTVTGVT
jgi:hypothetical protein